jgi:hypothetical protein
MSVRISGLVCAGCGSEELFALDPGQEPVRSAMPLFDVLLDAGSPTVARCLACALRKYSGLKVSDANLQETAP